jgi:hypothetical protein
MTLTVPFVILGCYAAFVLVVLFFKWLIVFQQYRVRRRQKWITLALRVPKENELGPIAAEQILTTFHSINKDVSFLGMLLGATPEQVSLEIANIGGTMTFYVTCPKRLRNLVEGQIYAQYPDVEIEKVEDYSDVRALRARCRSVDVEMLSRAVGAELELEGPDFDPIKRYPQFEDRIAKIYVDPMAGITSALSKLGDASEQVWLQIILRPLDDKWRLWYTRTAWLMNQGLFANIEMWQDKYANILCTRKIHLRIIFFPFYFFFWLRAVFSGTGKDIFSLNEEKAELESEATSKMHEKETADTARMDKIVKLLYEVNIRVVYVPKESDEEVNRAKLEEIVGSFKQFNLPFLNGISDREFVMDRSIVEKFRMRWMEEPFVLNSEELATIWHLPNQLVQTPCIAWVRSRKLEPPVDLPGPHNTDLSDLTLLGKTDFHSLHREFGIRTIDRRRHVYIIGKTGMGKSTLLENMICSDILAGKGVGLIDPHGDTADRVLDAIPAHRTNDVVIIDPSDRNFPVAFNMLDNIDPVLNSIVCSGLVGIFKKLYAESWGPRLEHILRNTILSLLEYPSATMLGITRVLQDDEFRRKVIKKVEDPIVKNFWLNEFEKYNDKQRMEAISPVLNKVGQFLSSPIMRNIVGQPKSEIDLRYAMDHQRIVIVNLSKGKIGEDNSSLLGSMIITKFQLDAMSRANIPEKDRVDFYLYVDEFQNFATDSFATILSEARKYRLNLTMANQYIAQMPEEVRDAVFGNVGSMISFQVGFDDAEYLSSQFSEEVMPPDLVSLSKYTAYTRLLIDGMPSRTFSMGTLPPVDLSIEPGRRDKIVRISRERFSQPREVVEDKIKRWSANGAQRTTGEEDARE